jgi:hypothetical protein
MPSTFLDKRRWTRRLAVGSVVVVVSSVVASGLSACLDATQIRVVLSGDSALCVGRPKYVLRVVETAAELARPSDDLNAGVPFPSCVGEGAVDLGDVMVVPQTSSDRAKAIVVEVAVGLRGQDPTLCTAASARGNPSCYVARRRIAFQPHTLLTLPVYFDERCAGETCDPASTCYRGTCVDSSATCVGTDCLTEAERAQGVGREPTRPVEDASTTDGASATDGEVHDGAVDAADATPDAAPDSGNCRVQASPAALQNSKSRCAGSSSCCGAALGLGTPPPCLGQDVERLCQTSCDCPSGADCVDVVSTATAYALAPRAACVMRGCPNGGQWGREGNKGNDCEDGRCCQSGGCLLGRCD